MNLTFRCKEGGDQFDSAYIFNLGMTLVTGSKCLRFFQNFQFQFEKKSDELKKKNKTKVINGLTFSHLAVYFVSKSI